MQQSSDIAQNLGFLWSSCRISDISVCHGLMHHGPAHCFQHFIIKLITTGKVASKYYLPFHLIPLIIRLKSCKNIKNAFKQIQRFFYDYGLSIAFMAFLVGLLRLGLCIGNIPKVAPLISNKPALFRIFGLLSATSILFEARGRRTQIAYYVSAKAMMALYVFFKRNLGWSGGKEGVILHIAMMSVLNYVYNHRPEILKFRKMFEYVIGEE